MKYLLPLILLLAITACNNQVEEVPESEAIVTLSANQTVSLSESITFNVETDQIIRIPQATYWTKAGPWQIFKKTGNDWEEVFFWSNCLNLCKDICEEENYCTPGGPYPGCNRVRNGGTFLKWDLTSLSETVTLCGADTKTCYEAEKVSPGTYKAVFSYRDTCEGGISWTLEESQIFTKEFIFEVVE